MGVLQEFDDFLKFLLGFVDSGDVFERHSAGSFGQQPGPGLAEAHGLAAAGLHLAHEEYPHPDQQQHREPGNEDREQGRRIVVVGKGADAYPILGQDRHQIGVVRGIGGKVASVTVMTGDAGSLKGDIADVTGFDGGQEVGKRQRQFLAALRRPLEEVEQGKHQKRDDQPQRNISTEFQVSLLLGAPKNAVAKSFSAVSALMR